MSVTASEKSTIVRSVTSSPRRPLPVPLPLRLGLAAAARISPALAGRAVARLFLTPPRHAAPPREREALARARPFTLRHRGVTLQAWWFGAGPTVLLVHGWGGRAGQLAPLAAALSAHGLAGVAFDAPAHGRSGGRTASVPAFAEAIVALAGQVRARAAVGHSMGAGALAWALAQGLRLDAAAFLAPPRGPGPFLDRLAEGLELPPAARQAARREVERRVGVRLEQIDGPALAPRAETPLLVVHDRDDAEVPFAEGAALARAWPGAALLPTQGLGHLRGLRDPAVLEAVAAFVAGHVPRRADPFDVAVASLAALLR